MPSTLIVGTNTYCTQAQADAYHDDRTHAGVWVAARDDDKDRALLTATRMLDFCVEWTGLANSSDQPLAWPRNWIESRFGPSEHLRRNYPDAFPLWFYQDFGGQIPREVREATAEYARHLLPDDSRLTDSPLDDGQVSVKAGAVAVAWDGTGRLRMLPDVVVSMIPREWILRVNYRARPGKTVQWGAIGARL